jgi:hypothetical protein
LADFRVLRWFLVGCAAGQADYELRSTVRPVAGQAGHLPRVVCVAGAHDLPALLALGAKIRQSRPATVAGPAVALPAAEAAEGVRDSPAAPVFAAAVEFFQQIG